ncbi:MAG TPA: membrane dipeptidase [Ktedonobacterales bacterium]
MFIVDAHEDIASNVLRHGRDVRRSVAETREIERTASREPGKYSPETAMIGLPDLRRGGVGLVFATIFVMPGEPEAMVDDGLAQLRYYAGLAESTPGVRIIGDGGALQRLRIDWQAAPTPAERPVGFTLLLEGADPLRDPSELAAWHAEGLRIVGPAWRGTRYAGGTGMPGGLTDLGRSLLREMESLGMILDISHLAEQSVWEALDAFSGVVIATHANCREYVPTDRQLSDETIRALAERDGVIGAVLHNAFLVGGYQRGSGVPVHLDAVVQHIDRVCQVTGSALHSAIGSDFDGGAGVESTPVELDSVADLGRIGDALRDRGYSASDVEGILGGNWLRVLHRGLPE